MFRFLKQVPIANTDTESLLVIATKPDKSRFSKRTLVVTMLLGALSVTACQQQTIPTDESEQTVEQQRVEADKPVAISDSATARIEQFQPLYVAQMKGLQQRLQAEYESLQAADATKDDDVSLLTAPKDTSSNAATSTDESVNQTVTTNETEAATNSTTVPEATVQTPVGGAINAETDKNESDINTSTEVGERDLNVLKRISLEPREPKIFTEDQIIERYQQAMQALYEPASSILSAQDTDTLLNVAALTPQLFEDSQIAEQVSIKSPALARLIVQYQVWQQIEAQQAVDMQQMKLTQQQEFEGLMSKFNNTIKDYDEQIAKYEQTLKTLQ